MTLPTWTLRLPRQRELVLGGWPQVMGVVNITPDSFSDGGRYLAPESAIAHGLALVAEGADMLDLGAESTRPGGGVYGAGAAPLSAEEEVDRLLPVLEALRAATDVVLSVDTRKAAVARVALAAGADLINDVAALADPEMAAIVAAAGCPVVLMHARGELATMQQGITFADVVAEVCAEQAASLALAVAGGIDAGQVLLDPGLGFGKTADQNLALLRNLDVLSTLGRPLLIGGSRKSFIGQVSGAAIADRLPGSLATACWAALQGAAIVRVHDVAATRQALAVAHAIANAPRHRAAGHGSSPRAELASGSR